MVTKENIVTKTLTEDGKILSIAYSWDNSSNHPSVEYLNDGYSGILQKTNVTSTGWEVASTYSNGKVKEMTKTYTATYSGIVTKENKID